jgi:hypothetical protein
MASFGPNEIGSSSSFKYSRPASSSGSTDPHRSRSSLRKSPNRKRRSISFLESLTCRRTVGRFAAFAVAKSIISAEEPVVTLYFNFAEIITPLSFGTRAVTFALGDLPRM